VHDVALRDLTSAVQDLQARLGDAPIGSIRQLELRLDLIESHLPELLNLVSSSHGSERRLRRDLADVEHRIAMLSSDIVRQWERIETVRREVMIELRYGSEPEVDLEPEAINPAVLDSARASGDVRLNLGCGHIPLEGYLNVDSRALPGVDLVASVGKLPFDVGEVAEIHSAHVLEHFPDEELQRRLLPYWVSLLRPGGTFRAIVPDAGAMIEQYARGEYDYTSLRDVLYGGQEYEGDFHFNMFTTESMAEILVHAGLESPTVVAQARRNGECLEFEIVATKPVEGG
jgi:hypothetical protein